MGQGRQSEGMKRQLRMALGQPLFIFFFLAYLACLVSFAVLIISFSLYFQFPCLGIHGETFGTAGRRDFRTSSLWVKSGERERGISFLGVATAHQPQCLPYT